ncbi:hypothetical protein COV24_03350 [candidate division WWE3 bacterium CG10_big_fil_rev_8_21_14_0_10_32_10]|uniref:50S ribosomal protein L29 n=1 Tax=candidate division WWE3 bacterium CG10_big_fil_rev_8_21_14_0_10_32_10 TaxID=1975090 RepID=A0A2H0RBD1_UNCKA|nr:MAG: hypothetical protein COV24_03350 [candidate division WWE3 bacterium CG10_big_fil_rev_8_21_14_0_10_32_10]
MAAKSIEDLKKQLLEIENDILVLDLAVRKNPEDRSLSAQKKALKKEAEDLSSLIKRLEAAEERKKNRV